jgi:hypothetical protein
MGDVLIGLMGWEFNAGLETNIIVNLATQNNIAQSPVSNEMDCLVF